MLYKPDFYDESWPRESLRELASWINGGVFRSDNLEDSGTPVIKISELKDGITASTKYSTGEHKEKYRVESGDVLLAWSGSPKTSIGVYRWNGPEGWLNQHIYRVEPEDGVDERWLEYLLVYLEPHFKRIAASKQTTGLGHLTKSDLERMEVAVPPLCEQRRIADIVKTFDDKSVIDERLNRNADLFLKTLHKSWFVDFDPMERDRSAEHDVQEFYPSGYTETVLGKVPAGWEVVPSEDIMKLEYGKSLPSKKRKAGSFPVVGSSGVTGNHEEALVDGPGIVLGRKGRVGSIWWLERDFWPIDTTYYVVPRSDAIGLRWLYYSLRRLPLERLGSHSAVPGLSRDAAYAQKLVRPPDPLIRRFEDIASRVFDLRSANRKQNRTLDALKGLVIPRLLSGRKKVE